MVRVHIGCDAAIHKQPRMNDTAWLLACTAPAGCLPLAVSPLSMTASHPSRTAEATSTHSARVGRALVVMLSSIWVAQMMGLPCSDTRLGPRLTLTLNDAPQCHNCHQPQLHAPRCWPAPRAASEPRTRALAGFGRQGHRCRPVSRGVCALATESTSRQASTAPTHNRSKASPCNHNAVRLR